MYACATSYSDFQGELFILLLPAHIDKQPDVRPLLNHTNFNTPYLPVCTVQLTLAPGDTSKICLTTFKMTTVHAVYRPQLGTTCRLPS